MLDALGSLLPSPADDDAGGAKRAEDQKRPRRQLDLAPKLRCTICRQPINAP